MTEGCHYHELLRQEVIGGLQIDSGPVDIVLDYAGDCKSIKPLVARVLGSEEVVVFSKAATCDGSKARATFLWEIQIGYDTWTFERDTVRAGRRSHVFFVLEEAVGISGFEYLEERVVCRIKIPRKHVNYTALEIEDRSFKLEEGAFRKLKAWLFKADYSMNAHFR